MIYAGEKTPADLNTIAPDDIRHDDGTIASITADPTAEKPAAETRPPKNKKAPPTCIMSGTALDPERMLRLVVGPENTLYADFAENLPGNRVFWCNLYGPTLRQALETNPFGTDIIIPETMMETIEKGLRYQALTMVSMARKAGHLYTGAEKTEQLIKSGKAAIYLTGSDKDADTRMKLTFLAGDKIRVIDLFSSEELSQASGMNKVYHAALLRGTLANRFFTTVKRMNLFRQLEQTDKPKHQDNA